MVQSARNWILLLFSIFMAFPFEEILMLRPPGVSFLFEVGIYLYSAQKTLLFCFIYSAVPSHCSKKKLLYQSWYMLCSRTTLLYIAKPLKQQERLLKVNVITYNNSLPL